MGGGISKMAKQELVATIRNWYQQSLKKEKGRILDEFTAMIGHHRKHSSRLLTQPTDEERKQVVGRRIYDEAVREAVIVVWEASDHICGKQLKGAETHLKRPPTPPRLHPPPLPLQSRLPRWSPSPSSPVLGWTPAPSPSPWTASGGSSPSGPTARDT